MTEPVHVLVHAGFHKTGTSSLQDFFRSNRAALSALLAYYGKTDFLNAGAAARIYAQRPFPWRLANFRRAFRMFLGSVPVTPKLLLSRETFCGAMPGHRKIGGRWITSYGPAAVPLAKAAHAELRRRFGPETRIEFLYTVRAPEDWLQSVHGHLLRSLRLRTDLDAFRARLGGIDLVDEAARIADALHPVPVHTARLEAYGTHPFGPAKVALDLLDIPAAARKGLRPAQRANPGPSPRLRADYLRLNGEIRNKARLKARKEALTASREPGR
ncbi:MAG: hypothetical protein AAGF74_15350 [Pseudomonadota bacterium]